MDTSPGPVSTPPDADQAVWLDGSWSGPLVEHAAAKPGWLKREAARPAKAPAGLAPEDRWTLRPGPYSPELAAAPASGSTAQGRLARD